MHVWSSRSANFEDLFYEPNMGLTMLKVYITISIFKEFCKNYWSISQRLKEIELPKTQKLSQEVSETPLAEVLILNATNVMSFFWYSNYNVQWSINYPHAFARHSIQKLKITASNDNIISCRTSYSCSTRFSLQANPVMTDIPII